MTTDVATFRSDDELVLANDLMQLGRVRHFPIMGEDGVSVVGMLSQRDLFRSALSSALRQAANPADPVAKSLVIGDVMSKSVRSVTPDETIEAAARIMSREKIGCLPVIDRDGLGLVGIVTESDLVRYVGEG